MNLFFPVKGYFPYGSAFASRALSFCKLFNQAGYEVHVMAAHTREPDHIAGETYDLGFCTYQAASIRPANAIESFFGNDSFRRSIRAYLASNIPDVVFANPDWVYYRWLHKETKQRNIPLVIEQCEWMDVTSFTFRIFDIRFLRMSWLIHRGYKKVSGIIAISRLLHNHYRDLGISTLRIPTILDISELPFASLTMNKKTRIVYAGSPGKTKEYLVPMIQALAENGELRDNFKFHIYGPTREAVIQNLDNRVDWLDSAGDSVIIHGSVPQQQIQVILHQADYTYFLRPDRRSSHAGFPTKLAESMAAGTPVISNNTGDIGLYVNDKQNGYLLDDVSVNGVVEKLYQILNVTEQEKQDMRANARKTSEEYFDYRVYVNMVKGFLEETAMRSNDDVSSNK